jgi:N-succinyldiaminopimelate aminotransferase
VYEHLTFGDRPHLSIASLPGMRERTVVISSAAKTFNVTGWKTGWACGPEPLIDGVRAAKQFMTFVAGGPFQPAVAYALEHEQEWVLRSRDSFDARRELLNSTLVGLGLDVTRCDGSYFICADVTSLGAADAMKFCRELPGRIGVAAVPVSVFTDNTGPWESFVRFTFCKSVETMREGVARLARLS